MSVYDDIEAPVALQRGHWRRTGLVLRWVDATDHSRCGTETGYYYHRRVLRNQACEPCKSAHRVAERLRAWKRRSRVSPLVERDSASEVWENRDGPSRAVSATRPGPDHRSALTGRG